MDSTDSTFAAARLWRSRCTVWSIREELVVGWVERVARIFFPATHVFWDLNPWTLKTAMGVTRRGRRLCPT